MSCPEACQPGQHRDQLGKSSDANTTRSNYEEFAPEEGARRAFLMESTTFSLTDSKELAGNLQPAAFRCPPPPNCLAIEATLHSPFALKLTEMRPDLVSLINTATFTGLIDRAYSINPSTS